MRRILLLASASVCFLASPGFTETSAQLPTAGPAASAPAEPVSQATLDAARAERLQRTELNTRMEAVIEASKKTLAGLQATINATTDPAMLKDLEGRMAQVKQGTTIDLLKVQATFARENGRIAQADEIDGQIELILHPKRPVAAPGMTDAARQAAAPAGGAR